MGISSSKSRKRERTKQIILVNKNVSDVNVEFNFDKSDDNEPPDIEEIAQTPTLKWHRANPREEILKIQREAEIRDIETIYENSRIKDCDLLNLMPDHYWSGMQNKLPRYVLYRGDYPDATVDKSSNLHRIKSSSLTDLRESICFYFDTNEDHNIDNQPNAQLFRSISCPHLNTTSIASLSTIEKDVPIKGILKNRKTNRPISAMIVDVREEKPVTVKMRHPKINTVVESSYPNLTPKETINNSNNSTVTKLRHNGVSNHLPAICVNDDEESIFSGYFDQSPTRANDGSLLKVNTDKKTWIKSNLDKRLNLRPTSMDLANRNILHDQDGYDRQNEFEQTRCLLNEKLSERPTLTELKKQRILKFSDFVEIQETDNYDRSVARPWGRLTEVDKESIRTELNEFKDKEMKIHNRSKRFTKFHDSHRV